MKGLLSEDWSYDSGYENYSYMGNKNLYFNKRFSSFINDFIAFAIGIVRAAMVKYFCLNRIY